MATIRLPIILPFCYAYLPASKKQLIGRSWPAISNPHPGKTHTMEGPKDNRGVYFCSMNELFDIANESRDYMNCTFQVSILEVYNETVNDLLSRQNARPQGGLDIRMLNNEVFVEGLVWETVSCCEDVENLIAMASSNRRVASNNVNEYSSRSHLVLSIKTSCSDLVTNQTRRGKLSLIGLAGSERLKETEALGVRLREAQNINRSLSALGDVVEALGKSSSHVPYRNSKLTFLLQVCV